MKEFDFKLAEEMVAKYGELNQLNIVIEELSEVIKEISKYNREKSHGESFDITRLKEEVADLMVVSEILYLVLERHGVTRLAVREEALRKQKRTRNKYLK